MIESIQAITSLSTHLEESNEEWSSTKKLAESHNAWFTDSFVQRAANTIIDAYLEEEKLTAFMAKYSRVQEAKTIGLVCAGNIPMVGFHDLLSVLLSGHKLKVKLSSKDEVLMKYVIEKLNEHFSIEIVDNLKSCDAYIATGSNQTHTVFKQYFGKYPSLLRKSRTSVAILDGNESKEQLEALADDVHLYFGLGCRNVTKIYAPKGYTFVDLIKTFQQYEYLSDHHKLKNNYDYNLSLFIMNAQYYMSTKSLLMVERKDLFSPISVVNFEFYDKKEDVVASLVGNEDLQAIVGKDHIPFGQAQCPTLHDFADGEDTMAFLTNL